jgi:hypothetical protein
MPYKETGREEVKWINLVQDGLAVCCGHCRGEVDINTNFRNAGSVDVH